VSPACRQDLTACPDLPPSVRAQRRPPVTRRSWSCDRGTRTFAKLSASGGRYQALLPRVIRTNCVRSQRAVESSRRLSPLLDRVRHGLRPTALRRTNRGYALLNCDVLPAVETPTGLVAPGQLGGADALRALIPAHVISTAEGTGQGLRIDFGGGAVRLHPEFDQVAGPEIVLLTGFTDGRWMCWRPGEESFGDVL
jgi:hypothetical protein